MRTLLDGLFDPNTVEREMLVTDDDGVEHLGIPIKFQNEPGILDFSVPDLGEHSHEIATSLGYSETEIQIMKDDRVI